MSRKKNFEHRVIPGDIKYNCTRVHKLINKIMMGGKKVISCRIVYNVLARLEKTIENSVGSELLCIALDIIKPSVYLRSKRIASRVYHVPIPIESERAIKRAVLWLVKGARRRKNTTIEDKLYRELLEVIQDKKGESMKMRDDYHRVAKENEAFIHYV